MFVVGVYVTSRYKNYPEFKVTLDEALKKYIPTGKPNALCTGSSKSNESGNGLVKKYAFEHGIPCRVFETQWANNIPTKPGKKNTAGVRANAMIIRNSNACVLFWTPTAIAKWDFMSGGCYNFRKMCGKMGRELIEIKADIYKPIDNEIEDEKITTVPDREHGGEGMQPIGEIPGSGGLRMAGGDEGGGDGGVLSGLVGGGGGHSVMPMVGGGSPTVRPTVGGTPDIGDGESSAQAGSSPIAPSINLPRTGSGISEIPVDINGDGTPDTSIAAMDTTGDGVPDSQLTPVDVDNNGTIDRIELTPLPQTTQQPSPQPTSAVQQQAQTTEPAVQPTAVSTAAQSSEEENQGQ